MKWFWPLLLGLAAPLLVLLAAGVILHQPGLPQPAQKSLDAWLAQQSNTGPAPSVQMVRRAAHPSAFTRNLSAARFGDAYYFDDESRPAPFPPTDLWCVTLRAGQPYTVLVAQHEDMHVAGWFVHKLHSPADATAICN